MKIVFMGTPDFAVPSLEALIDKFGVEAVDLEEEERKWSFLQLKKLL